MGGVWRGLGAGGEESRWCEGACVSSHSRAFMILMRVHGIASGVRLLRCRGACVSLTTLPNSILSALLLTNHDTKLDASQRSASSDRKFDHDDHDLLQVLGGSSPRERDSRGGRGRRLVYGVCCCDCGIASVNGTIGHVLLQKRHRSGRGSINGSGGVRLWRGGVRQC